MEPSILLRPVTDKDEALLRRVYASTREEELALTPWDEEQKNNFIDMQFEAQHTHYTKHFPDAEQSVVLGDGEPVGRIWIDRREDEIRLLDLTILTRHRGAGIGTVLLRRLQTEARETGRTLRHSVLVTNHRALDLYRRLGFSVVDDSHMHLLMEWTGGD